MGGCHGFGSLFWREREVGEREGGLGERGVGEGWLVGVGRCATVSA